MNVARQLITKIVDDQHIKTPLESGIDLAWLNNPDSRAVFDGKDRDCYLFILEHYNEYDQVPDREQILENFDPSYKFDETDRNMEFLLDQVTINYTRGMADIGIGDLVDAFQEDRIDDVVAIARSLVAKADALGRPTHNSSTLNDVAKDIMGFIGRPKAAGIKMMIPAVDKHFGGMQPGQLITLLGRNKGMKTWLLLKLAATSWDQGASSVVFSVELSSDQITERLISIFTETNYEKIRNNDLRDSEIRHIEEVARAIVDDEAAVKVTIERDFQSFTVDDVRRSIERHNPKIVFIDGFYFMYDPETKRSATHHEAHENIAANLKRLAEKMEVTIVVTTQVQEKQHNAKDGVTGASMAGGTGLLKASDLVLGVDKPERQSSIQKLPMVANREGEPTDSAIQWDFDTMNFVEVELAAIVDTDEFAL